jgi:hypothetical protein
MTEKVAFSLFKLLVDVALLWMLFGRAGKRGPAKVHSNGRVEFAPDWIGLSAFPLTVVYLVGSSVKAVLHNHGRPNDFFSPIVLTAAALYLLLTFPGTLLTSNSGIEQAYWFRKNKRIRWSEIVEVETDKNGGRFTSVTVTDAHGIQVIHSSLLADRERFMIEIEKHCRENLPPEFFAR